MIINFAYAQAAGASGGQGLLVQLLPLILIGYLLTTKKH